MNAHNAPKGITRKGMREQLRDNKKFKRGRTKRRNQYQAGL